MSTRAHFQINKNTFCLILVKFTRVHIDNGHTLAVVAAINNIEQCDTAISVYEEPTLLGQIGWRQFYLVLHNKAVHNGPNKGVRRN